MRWGPKTDIIALLLAGGGFILVDLAVGIVAPIIINIKQGNFGGITTIVVLLVLICAIYLLDAENIRINNQKPSKTISKSVGLAAVIRKEL